MDILLIGGTGILSTEICSLAIERGINVTTVNRGLRKEFLNPLAINIVADVIHESVDSLNRKINFKKYDVVIDFISRNLDQLMKMISIVGNNCKQFVFISSASCYKEISDDHIYIELDDIHNDKWDYCIKKAECEDYLLSKKWPFEYTIIRPYITYGKTRIPFQLIPLKYYTIIDRIMNRKPIVMVKTDAICTLTNTMDFAIGVVGLLDNPKAYGEAFHITSNCTYTWKMVAGIIGDTIGIEPDIIEIDIKTLKKISNPGFEVEELIGDKTRNMVFDNSKIKSIVPDYTGNIFFEDTIKDTMAYFNEGSKQIVDHVWNGCIDRIISQCTKDNITMPPDRSLKEKFMYCVGRYEILYQMARSLKRWLK